MGQGEAAVSLPSHSAQFVHRARLKIALKFKTSIPRFKSVGCHFKVFLRICLGSQWNVGGSARPQNIISTPQREA